MGRCIELQEHILLHWHSIATGGKND